MMYGYRHKSVKIKSDSSCMITADGYFSHRDYAVLLSDEIKKAHPILYTVTVSETRTIGALIGELAPYELADYEHIIQRISDGKPSEYLLVKSKETDKAAYISRQYVDHVLSIHPTSLPHIQGWEKPIISRDSPADGRVTGVIMPVILLRKPQDEVAE